MHCKSIIGAPPLVAALAALLITIFSSPPVSAQESTGNAAAASQQYSGQTVLALARMTSPVQQPMQPYSIPAAFFTSSVCGITNPAPPALGPISTDDFYASIEGSAFLLGLAVLNAAKNGYVKAADFDKLDFHSGDIEHGWNPAYRPGPGKRCFIDGPNMDSTLKGQIRAATSHSWNIWETVPTPIINLRREDNDNLGALEILYLIIPGVKERTCTLWYPKSTSSHPTMPIVIGTDSHHLIEDEKNFLDPFFKGCVRGNDGHVYLFAKIVGKYKRSGEEQWRMMR